jgi:hypothetical protein
MAIPTPSRTTPTVETTEIPESKPAPKTAPSETAHGVQDPEAYVPTPHGEQPA